jgi:uncharacterized protein with HEPN domain
MKRDLKLFIEDILENINLIEDSTRGLSVKQFESNRLIIDATLRRLEIIGEAVKNLPDSFKNKHLTIPWKDIAGFRDKLTHAYFGVLLERVWNIIDKDLHSLKKEIEKIQIEN